MSDFYWVLHNEAGSDLRSSDRFENKEDAEQWMGREWSSLLEEGAETVTLFEGDKKHYRMGLRSE